MSKQTLSVVVFGIVYLIILANLPKQETIKERKQIVIIKSVGVEHVYEVDNRTVRVEYEDAE